jgi:hypothetical protein
VVTATVALNGQPAPPGPRWSSSPVAGAFPTARPRPRC